jgi:hypothetical protein
MVVMLVLLKEWNYERAVEIRLGGMIQTPGFMKIAIGIQAILRCGLRNLEVMLVLLMGIYELRF